MTDKPPPRPPIRQRNTTGNRYTFAATEDRPAFAVEPGDTSDYPVLLHGWTPVNDDPQPAGETRPAAKTSAGKTKGSDSEGSEPR